MTMLISGSLFRKIDRLDPDLKEVMISMVEEWERYREDMVTKVEFGDLREIVKELAEAQKRTEIKVAELVEAQKRTDAKVAELTEAQKRTEIKVAELAEAQKRTDAKVAELTEAQKRTEAALQALTQEVRALTADHKETRRQLGGLAQSVGYVLEDRIAPHVADFAKKIFGVDIALLDRRNLIYEDGKYDELNIYAEGAKNDRPAYVIGECKSQPGKRDLDRFAKVIARARQVLPGDIHYFIVGHQVAPEVEDYARQKYPDLKLFNSLRFTAAFRRSRVDRG
ncbi:MAG: hypothetical protein QM278_07245 [Pseudomonadota bacterium]|nr:hypothetical protein [Pseudomonadota bacterium]